MSGRNKTDGWRQTIFFYKYIELKEVLSIGNIY